MGLCYGFIRTATPVAVRKQREIISFHLLNLNYYFPNRDNIWDHIVFLSITQFFPIQFEIILDVNAMNGEHSQISISCIIMQWSDQFSNEIV